MIQRTDVQIYLHRTPVDFRKSINRLLMIVQSDMALSPSSEVPFVFGNSRRDKIKIPYWDKTGFCLWYKRLEKDKFKWPRIGDATLGLSIEQFSRLLRGLDITTLKSQIKTITLKFSKTISSRLSKNSPVRRVKNYRQHKLSCSMRRMIAYRLRMTATTLPRRLIFPRIAAPLN